jgi:hypothetical protein
MSNVSRRQFLRNASLGAAAAGALAVGGTGLVTAITAGGPATSAGPAIDDEAADGTDVFARVVDARSGHIKIYVGHKEVDYTNQSLAQQLLRASQ